jgi:[ribosomal protein S5]-alanine N-acetyltransferase
VQALDALAPVATRRLTLRLVSRADLPDLFTANADDAVTYFLPYASWKSLDDAAAWFDRAAARLVANESAQFVIVHNGTRRVIGSCLLFNIDVASARAEIGYLLARDHWGAGYMLEALRALVALSFGSLGLRRLEAQIDPRNVPSAKLLERLGFVREGLLRQRWLAKGELADCGFYGLLREPCSPLVTTGAAAPPPLPPAPPRAP